ncbi:MAG: hypothetical protein LBG92_00160 [Prevotellaceae bacterium]|nr:hypothetical protein [Prevotellaceae bacterium]
MYIVKGAIVKPQATLRSPCGYEGSAFQAVSWLGQSPQASVALPAAVRKHRNCPNGQNSRCSQWQGMSCPNGQNEEKIWVIYRHPNYRPIKRER